MQTDGRFPFILYILRTQSEDLIYPEAMKFFGIVSEGA